MSVRVSGNISYLDVFIPFGVGGDIASVHIQSILYSNRMSVIVFVCSLIPSKTVDPNKLKFEE